MSSAITKNFDLKLNVDHLSNNLRYLMRKTGTDAAELSKRTNIALTTINGLKRGAGNPTLSTLKTIAEFFNITIGQLTESNICDNPNKTNLIEIPLLEVTEIQEFLDDSNKFNSSLAIDLEKTSDNIFSVRISNNAMAPLFEKGTIFIVCHELQPQDGDIALIQFSNQLPCFRRIFIEGEAYIFRKLSEISISGNEIFKTKNFLIHGIVIKAIQNFHEL